MQAGTGPALSCSTHPPTHQPTAPAARRGLHSLTAVGSRLFLFGGAPQRGAMLDDLWVLDTAQQPLRWRALAPEGPRPPARCSHVAAALGQQLVVLGGAFYR